MKKPEVIFFRFFFCEFIQIWKESSGMLKDGFFAASNSGKGFRNYYNEVFGGADRIFVIKGGPGTGKSRFMRDVAEYAKTRGWRAEYYYCSSDAASLDGVMLKRGSESTAVIDGTPPHVWEPMLPGVREEIVNLGVFWNAGVLRASSDEICQLIRKRADLWRSAYRWLSGCLDMCGIIKTVGASCVNYEAVSSAARVAFDGVQEGERFSLRPALLTSIGMSGIVTSGEFIGRAKKLYVIKDKYITAYLLINELLLQAEAKKLSIIISYDPIDAECPDGLFIENCSMAFVVTDKTPDAEYTSIEMEKLMAAPEPAKAAQASFAERCRDSMLGGAVEALAEIKECHFKLESIYTSSMDFKAKEAFTADFCKKYFTD
jgi:hypothetical protein